MAVFGIKTNKCKQEVIPKGEIYDAVYPVGSIYMSVNNVNPATLFGGTWAKISGRFLLASNSSHAVGETGGAETVSYTPAGSVGNHTLTVSEIPAHNHTYSKPGSTTGSTTLTSSQIPAHTHTYSKAGSTTGSTTLTTAQIPAHTHTYAKANSSTGSTTLTVDQIPSHTHPFNQFWLSPNGSVKTIYSGSTNTFQQRPISQDTSTLPNTEATGGSKGHTHTIGTASTASGSAGSGNGHSHTISSSNAASGSTGGGNGHTHTITTSSTNSGSTGGSSGHNHGFTGTAARISTMSPYLVVNVWERTA